MDLPLYANTVTSRNARARWEATTGGKELHRWLAEHTCPGGLIQPHGARKERCAVGLELCGPPALQVGGGLASSAEAFTPPCGFLHVQQPQHNFEPHGQLKTGAFMLHLPA